MEIQAKISINSTLKVMYWESQKNEKQIFSETFGCLIDIQFGYMVCLQY